MLEEFLGREKVAPIYGKDWVDVMIDVDRDTHGKKINERLKGERSGGLPWMVILDADGKELISSNRQPGGQNIGGPVSEEECDWFFEMLKQSGKTLDEKDLEVLRKELSAHREKHRRR